MTSMKLSGLESAGLLDMAEYENPPDDDLGEELFHLFIFYLFLSNILSCVTVKSEMFSCIKHL